MKILVDEMYDGFDVELQKRGYEAYSVKKLIQQGKRLRSDYSVITYAKENGMILVTGDVENGLSCDENSIPYVLLDKNEVINTIVEKLKKIQNS